MLTLDDFIREMPKVELHVHLEGSVRPQTLLTLATRNNVALPATTVESLREWYKFTSFTHFVDVYRTISRCMQTPNDIELVTREFLSGQAAQHILYSEVTYTAYTHYQQKGISFKDQLDAINRARAWARETLSVDMGLIIDIDRSLSADEGMVTARWAVEGMADGVIALGIGGAEVGNPPQKFEQAFALARSAGLRSICHAGETAGPKSIWGALRVLGAMRIGHGIRCLEDPVLVEELRARQIPLEVCPTSNVCLAVTPSWEHHPLPKLMEAGLYVTLNSDDPPMFNTTLTQEYHNTVRVFGFSLNHIETLLFNAVNATCLPDEQYGKLVAEVSARLADLHTRLDEGSTPVFETVLRTDTYETVRLSPFLYLNRWFRTPTSIEGMQFVQDLEKLLDSLPHPISFISDLRRGVIKDVGVIDKLAKLPQHRNWAHATAFGSVTSTVYTGVYERLARKKDYSEETWPTFEKAIQYLEQQQSGLTQGIDWRAALQKPEK
jgi:adenosine deaminase